MVRTDSKAQKLDAFLQPVAKLPPIASSTSSSLPSLSSAASAPGPSSAPPAVSASAELQDEEMLEALEEVEPKDAESMDTGTVDADGDAAPRSVQCLSSNLDFKKPNA